MKIFRYEKKDGGGPWCTRDGIVRAGPSAGYKFNDNDLYGCITEEALEKYFANQLDMIKDCYKVIYEVPDKEVKVELRQVSFPKKYSPITCIDYPR